MTTTTEAEHICPPDHKHGLTNTCRTNHRCRCDNCRAAHRAYSRQVRREKAYGRYEPSLISARGAHRRIQALARQGWSQKRQGDYLGWAQQRVGQVLASERITKGVHAQIAQMFASLWDKEPQPDTHWDRASVLRTRRDAAARGWPRPLDWDDIDDDDGPAVAESAGNTIDDARVAIAITGATIRLTAAEKRAAVEALHPQGLNDKEIAARIHCSDRTVLRIRAELDLPHNDTLYNRPAAA